MHRIHRVLLCFVLAVLTRPVLGATFYVGSCHVGAYPRISAAVAAVPAGSIVSVCPGTYPEQVQITKAFNFGLDANFLWTHF